jgi:hypothetical protein
MPYVAKLFSCPSRLATSHGYGVFKNAHPTLEADTLVASQVLPTYPESWFVMFVSQPSAAFMQPLLIREGFAISKAEYVD